MLQEQLDSIKELVKLGGSCTLGLRISHEEIKTKNFDVPIEWAKTLVENQNDLSNIKFFITFDGYDNDPRELYMIQEARQYIIDMYLKAPELLYFVDEDCKRLAMCALAFKHQMQNNIEKQETHTEVNLKLLGRLLIVIHSQMEKTLPKDLVRNHFEYMITNLLETKEA